MKKKLCLILAVCFVFCSFVFTVSAETPIEYATPIEYTENVLYLNYNNLSGLDYSPTWDGEGFEPVIIETKEDMDAFAGCFETYDAKEFDKYDEAFFEESSIIFVCAHMSDYGYSYKITSLTYDDSGKIVFDFLRMRRYGEAASAWLTAVVIAEVDKAVIEDSTGVEGNVTTSIEYTENVLYLGSYGDKNLKDIGLEPTTCGEGFEPVVIDSKEYIDTVAGCFEMYDASAFDKYDEAFFETKSIILVCAGIPDYGYDFEIRSLEYYESGNIVFEFMCTRIWGEHPTESRTILVIAEVDKAVIEYRTGTEAKYEFFQEKQGDADYNGIVDSTDYLMIKRVAFGTYTLDEDIVRLVDINYDNAVDSADYSYIKRLAFN